MSTSSGTEREIQLFSLILMSMAIGMGICGLQKNQNQAIAAPPSLAAPSPAAVPSLVIPSLTTPSTPAAPPSIGG